MPCLHCVNSSSTSLNHLSAIFFCISISSQDIFPGAGVGDGGGAAGVGEGDGGGGGCCGEDAGGGDGGGRSENIENGDPDCDAF